VAGKVVLIHASGKITWEHPANHTDDVSLLPGGNILMANGHGVIEVTPDHKVVFEYQTKSEVFACQRLADGNTFIGECNGGRLLEVAPDGKIVKEVRLLPEGKDGGHGFMRNARKLAGGTYLVPHTGKEIVCEYDSDGKKLREVKIKGGPHSVVELANKNWLITVGDRPGGSRVCEVEPTTGKVVWEVNNDDLADRPLKFVAGVQVLPNGNILVCNWVGHGQFGKAPHLLEITRDKKIVWNFNDHKNVKTASSVQVVGIPSEGMR
jgi:outer membrane protein assembly factor BamB